MQFSSKSSSGFTLIELMIAMSIFAMMSVMVMTIYFSTTETARKLNAQRQLAESAREIIDHISANIVANGFRGATPEFDTNYDLWKKYDYTGSGSEYFNLKNGRYVYGSKTTEGMKTCTGEIKNNPKIHCGLYWVDYLDNGKLGYNLVDSSVPDEDHKRIKISDMKFYVSGDDVSNTHKLMISLDLSLMPRNGISAILASTTTLHIQTTISERGWRKEK